MRWWEKLQAWFVGKAAVSKIEKTLTLIAASEIPDNLGKCYAQVLKNMLTNGAALMKDETVRRTVGNMARFLVENEKDIIATYDKLVDVMAVDTDTIEFAEDETVEKIKEIWKE